MLKEIKKDKVKLEKIKNFIMILQVILFISILISINYFVGNINDNMGIGGKNLNPHSTISSINGEEMDKFNNFYTYRNILKIDKRTEPYSYYSSQVNLNYPKDILFINNGFNKYRVFTKDNTYYKKVLGLENGEVVKINDKVLKDYENTLGKYDYYGNKLSKNSYNKIRNTKVLLYSSLTLIFITSLILYIIFFKLDVIQIEDMENK